MYKTHKFVKRLFSTKPSLLCWDLWVKHHLALFLGIFWKQVWTHLCTEKVYAQVTFFVLKLTVEFELRKGRKGCSNIYERFLKKNLKRFCTISTSEITNYWEYLRRFKERGGKGKGVRRTRESLSRVTGIYLFLKVDWPKCCRTVWGRALGLYTAWIRCFPI